MNTMCQSETFISYPREIITEIVPRCTCPPLLTVLQRFNIYL